MPTTLAANDSGRQELRVATPMEFLRSWLLWATLVGLAYFGLHRLIQSPQGSASQTRQQGAGSQAKPRLGSSAQKPMPSRLA